jgi:ketosteroid isomerase-like protein
MTARQSAGEFVRAWNARDLDAFDRLFHRDFQWHITVTEHGDPNMRPLHSELLTGKNLPWQRRPCP